MDQTSSLQKYVCVFWKKNDIIERSFLIYFAY